MRQFLISVLYRLLYRLDSYDDDNYDWTPSPYVPPEPLPPPQLPAGVPVPGTIYRDEYGRVFVWMQVKGQVEIAYGHVVMGDQVVS